MPLLRLSPLLLTGTTSNFQAKSLTLTSKFTLPPLKFPKSQKPPLTTLWKTTLAFSSPAPPPGTVQVADLVERDWSFLELNDPADTVRFEKIDKIIRSARLEQGSKTLVSFGSVSFIEWLVRSGDCSLIVAVHESLLQLAMVKEKHDSVRCWQGGIDAAPERFGPFDAVFVCYFPGMGVSVDQLLQLIAPRCSQGARVVISYDQGREVAQQEHRQYYSDMAAHDLPDRTSLEKAAAKHFFKLLGFTDDSNFYLAVLAFTKAEGATP